MYSHPKEIKEMKYIKTFESHVVKEHDLIIEKLISKLKEQKINFDIKDESYEDEQGEFTKDIIVFSINTEYGKIIVTSEEEDYSDDYNPNMMTSVEIDKGFFTNEWIHTKYENDLFVVFSRLWESTYNHIKILSEYLNKDYDEVFNRCEEFELTKDNKTIDLISLNQIYDFYNVDFSKFNLEKFNKRISIMHTLSGL